MSPNGLKARGDLRSAVSAGSGDPRRAISRCAAAYSGGGDMSDDVVALLVCAAIAGAFFLGLLVGGGMDTD